MFCCWYAARSVAGSGRFVSGRCRSIVAFAIDGWIVVRREANRSVTFAAVAVGLGAVAMLACYVPAGGRCDIDPMRRYDTSNRLRMSVPTVTAARVCRRISLNRAQEASV